MYYPNLSRPVISWSLIISYILNSSFAQTSQDGNRRSDYPDKERIVTDIDVINGPHGVALDFTYNETRHDLLPNLSQLVSAPGCPQSIDGYPWIYHNQNGYHRMSSNSEHDHPRCYLAGSQGPCPVGQVLLVQSGSMYGICSCECLLSSSSSSSPNGADTRNGILEQQRYQLCYSKSVPQGQAYGTEDKRICYNLDEQGPCEDNTVLAKRWVNNGSMMVIACLPICNLDDVDWTMKQIDGLCTIPFQGFASGAGFSANLQQDTSCPEDERYSVTLKKCLKRHPISHLIIG